MIGKPNYPKYTLILHILVWMVLFGLPYFLSSGEKEDIVRAIRFTWPALLFSIVIFYLNYFLLIDKFLLKKKIGWFLLFNSILLIIIGFTDYYLKTVLFKPLLENKLLIHSPPHRQPNHLPSPPFKWIIYRDNIYILMPIIISIALKITEKWSRIERERTESENQKLNSELNHLKYQLQPHFFFNSLNNIYSLIEISPSKAQQTIHTLSKLMRYLLYETNSPKVKLADEINFIQKYIELMAMRTNETKVSINTSIENVSEEYKIAPLLFISLIENAFKHGVSAIRDSEIIFKLNIESDTVIFTAENTNFPKTETDISGSGIGLSNLIKRLDLIYPGRYGFKTIVENGFYKTTLRINLSDNI